MLSEASSFNPNAIGVGAWAKRLPRTPLALRLNKSLSFARLAIDQGTDLLQLLVIDVRRFEQMLHDSGR